MAGVDLADVFQLEPAEAIKYFESKGYALGFDWREVWQEAHARAFTVAGVLKTDVLQDIRQALADALKRGTTYADFRAQLTPVLQRKGWLGSGSVVDTDTGEIYGRQLTPRRLETIWSTNLQSAYMAGRWAAQMEQVDTHPWWEYVAVLDNRTRPAHAALNGECYRYDDPFWATFYPPNGYRCRCRVRVRRAREVNRDDDSASRLENVEQPIGRGETQPAVGFKTRGGQVVTADPGFGFNPGQEWQRPFTPPPNPTPAPSFPRGVNLPPLRPTRVPAYSLQPAGAGTQAQAGVFLKAFGLLEGESRALPLQGGPLVVSADLFRAADGSWINLGKNGAYIGLLAQTAKEPDEVWLRWQLQDDRWQLARRFIRAWDIDGRQMATVFETTQGGWQASAVPAEQLPRQRDGFMLYRRAGND
ncbi:phage minor head protein [Chromobacterium subtsugae]|uniref:phage minor head protein n=1 Tax=Chromobacterium subtsugae TaxID=251747 RepID=UPI00064153E9|nr:phage minor head protein [Chromobacterium subtsugae]